MTQAIQPATTVATMPPASDAPSLAAPQDPVQMLVPVLQELVNVIGQLVGLLAAQTGAGLVQPGGCDHGAVGGGSAPDTTAIGVTTLQPPGASASQPAVSAQPDIPAAQPVVQPMILQPQPIVIPAVIAQPIIQPGASSMAGGPSAAPEAPISIGSQYLHGTPQAGGVVDMIIRNAQTSAMPAMNGGTYMWVMDGAGAGIYAHVHGFWGQYPDQIASGIQSGKIAVHLHPDGSVHLHDVSY